MVVSIIAFVVASHQAETWDLKPSFDPKAAKQVWGVIVDAEMAGQKHHATFDLTRLIKSKDDKKTVSTYGWDKLSVDDQDGQALEGWDTLTGSNNELLKMEGDGDDNFRRMLTPLVFVYPTKTVSVGDTWTSDVKPNGNAPKFTYTYTAKSKALIHEVSTLVIDVKLKEDVKDGMTADGTWWVSKAGRVMQFEMNVKNWVVPMAGSDNFDATLKGKQQ